MWGTSDFRPHPVSSDELLDLRERVDKVVRRHRVEGRGGALAATNDRHPQPGRARGDIGEAVADEQPQRQRY